jgi:hypothetical protein
MKEINNNANAQHSGALLSWIFGILVLVAGIINIFWGNDQIFGVFIVLLSFVYFPWGDVVFQRIANINIPGRAKLILAIVIIWILLGVGELFTKINLMTLSLQ